MPSKEHEQTSDLGRGARKSVEVSRRSRVSLGEQVSPRRLRLRVGGQSGTPVGTAATMVMIYVALLLGLPSNMTVGSLGSLGRPAMLWGLGLLLWWFLARAQANQSDLPSVSQPLRLPLVAFILIALTSFAAAMLRGQPADQVSPAVTAMLRIASWTGVLLITMDGVRTLNGARHIIRALTYAGGVLGGLGLAQFVTGNTLLDWMAYLPGISIEQGGVVSRGTYTRSAGTAIHPLEYTTVLTSILPLALVAAINYDSWKRPRSQMWILRICLALIASAAMIAVSRSAMIGLLIASISSIPALPRRYRWIVVLGGVGLGAVMIAVIPGLLGTVVGLFLGAKNDPSTASRTGALALAPDFMSASPVIGVGFGTFLPRYYIFDNQWLLLMIELGVLGVAAFVLLGLLAIRSAWRVGALFPDNGSASISRAVAASLATIMVLFLFFDGLSFPQSGGLFFVMVGLAAVMRTVWKPIGN